MPDETDIRVATLHPGGLNGGVMTARFSLISGGPVRVGLRLLVAAGLAVDAFVHFDLASTYDSVGASITQGTLFRIAAAAAVLTALLVLLIGRMAVYVAAFLVAISALAAVLIYQWADIGAVGPLPDMYEPVWYPEKTISALGEAVAAGAAALLVAHRFRVGHAVRRSARVGGAHR
jgi:hypothetical protein